MPGEGVYYIDLGVKICFILTISVIR
jgi:hypothetical protein